MNPLARRGANHSSSYESGHQSQLSASLTLPEAGDEPLEAFQRRLACAMQTTGARGNGFIEK
jgi:hypothetical protein